MTTASCGNHLMCYINNSQLILKPRYNKSDAQSRMSRGNFHALTPLPVVVACLHTATTPRWSRSHAVEEALPLHPPKKKFRKPKNLPPFYRRRARKKVDFLLFHCFANNMHSYMLEIFCQRNKMYTYMSWKISLAPRKFWAASGPVLYFVLDF